MWRIRERLHLGDYASGRAALLAPSGSPAAVVSLCPVPLGPGELIDGPACPATEWLLAPIRDGGNGQRELEGVLEVALPFIDRKLRDGDVLVHCAAGVSRSPVVVAAWLCRHGATPLEALRTVRTAKARALGAGSSALSIAPAPELLACLERLFGRASERC